MILLKVFFSIVLSLSVIFSIVRLMFVFFVLGFRLWLRLMDFGLLLLEFWTFGLFGFWLMDVDF